ncbi:WSC domain-containing protein [Apiospora rasikravindrae]|uniref:WSC domain-containing protein n=1 Tax=Apiospora rasikravindrae TaxID=990691 RepID=A0ABR1UDH8_9PEZI
MGSIGRSVLASLAFLASVSLADGNIIRKDLPAGWNYTGCYTETFRTLGSDGYVDNGGMTVEKCLAYCDKNSYPYGGVEYYHECYCGGTIATGAKMTSDSSCNTPCDGNKTESCGGAGFLSLYRNPKNVGPMPNTGVPGWKSIGCYSEGTNGRTLTYQANTGNNNSAVTCTSACGAAGFSLAGTEYSGQCFCGNSFLNGGAPATSGCSMLCSGNSTEICGGPDRLNVYSNGNALPSTTTAPGTPSTTATTSTAGPTPTGPSQPAKVGNYNWYGCQLEVGGRTLQLAAYADDSMTLESCQAFCSGKGATYFGTEYGRECYCGNSFQNGPQPAPASDCSQLCAGNPYEYCGNGNRLSVYVKNGTAPLPSSSSSSTAGSAPTSTSTSAAVPTTTGLPAGWTAQGCWQDGPNGRIIPTYQNPDSDNLTPQSCAYLCQNRGYTISGTEFSRQCFCGNAIYNGGHVTSDPSQCSNTCSGDSSQICGGPGYLSIVSQGTPQVYQPPVVQTGGLNNTWTYIGCYNDNVNQERTLPWALHYPGTNTATECLAQCALYGYPIAGVEYGEECYCGDPGDLTQPGVGKQPESDCNIPCAGNASAICGGGSRLSTYQWSGAAPLYVFGNPTGNDAGTYSNLVGGVVTPLLTMQSITGKVTFLEKWGTGAPNSTGAYELDLSQVGNFSAAWRTMHLKTDVFCNAGITLPDKAGRQLTVGGWSLDSTFGVRLYWPDGSPGVKDVNDWQENVDILRLQVGRWYPSAMIMANGSVLIVGGEKGSNAAPEPTLEILPPTGTKPLYMDWLEKTDPNNLYPFLAVLPSGGIFASVWNEGRILDENTFQTIKTMPMMPTSVNDIYGGRTYPLEGTAVLLPQYAPYTDPLGVFICGGASGGREGLDNCVTIYPEAAQPQWTLERMPSKRVMSCMAPLPDGTYLIANGAKEGVAGFGLATDPNYQAVLYDPSKPVGQRMSNMATTIVARLYHSEAITLLDGRVLITGSDPEDGVHPEEMRVEVFTPPYLLKGKPRPSFNLTSKDWGYGQTVNFNLGGPAVNGALKVSLLGAVASTHGNSMGARTLFPAMSCSGTSCKVTAPPNAHVCPPGWYQFFVLDGGIPAVGVYVRIGGDPAQIGNWPNATGFSLPGM